MKEEVDQIKNTIARYIETYYRMLGNQDYNPYLLKDYFAYSLKGNHSFVQEEIALKNRINHNSQLANYLLFEQPEIDIKWRLINKSGRQCQVHMGLDIKMQYRGVEDYTTIKNLEHFFTLTQEGTIWRIEEDRYENEFKCIEIEDGKKEKKKKNRKKNRKNKEWLLMEREEKSQPKGIYMREKAVAYAKKYALTPNTKEWKNYEEWGGDCTNFVSQCLFEGNIPFDHQGRYINDKWYWYSDHYRTPSFTSATAFKDYMLRNKGFGLVARLGSLQTMQLGDIVQLGDLQMTTHSMIVVDIVKDENDINVTKDLLIAQHSGVGGIRGYNIPLSSKPNARVYYNILGYNP